MREPISYDSVYEEAQAKRDLYLPLGAPIVRTVMNAMFLRSVEGKENIPDVPAMYMANHTKLVDSPLLALAYVEATEKPLRLIAKKEYFEGGGIDDNGKLGKAIQFAISRTGQIPVDRDGSKSSLTEFNKRTEQVLKRGDSIGIHPEGTRVRDGKLHSFQKGAAAIAINARVPMVPVAISYHEIENARRPLARIQFGEPLTADEYGRKGAYIERATKIIEDRVANLLGFTAANRSNMLARAKRIFTHQNDDDK